SVVTWLTQFSRDDPGTEEVQVVGQAFSLTSRSTQAKARLTFGRRVSSSHNLENGQGHQVEQQDSDLVDRHPGIVKRVELLPGEMKPPSMQAVHPLVRKHETEKPDQQDRVVDDCAPEKEVAREVGAHGLSSLGIPVRILTEGRPIVKLRNWPAARTPAGSP